MTEISNARRALFRAAKDYAAAYDREVVVLKASHLEKAAMDFAKIYVEKPGQKEYVAAHRFESGTTVKIPVSELEFSVGNNTFWVHSPAGATVLRVKSMKPIKAEGCKNSPVSHLDIVVKDELVFCVGPDAEL